MKRREFITLLGGAAAAWPLAARAQRLRRIGVLIVAAPDDADAQTRLAALRQGLQQFGWIEGRNLQIDARWGAGDAAATRRAATELAALVPDVIVASGSAGAAAVLQATRTVPTVFVIVPDPVGSGCVESLWLSPAARHWLYDVRIQFEREMAGTAQRDRTGCDAGGGASRSRYHRRD
jgi:putative tryptophan/tyrosine transport system substrate-binding protein